MEKHRFNIASELLGVNYLSSSYGGAVKDRDVSPPRVATRLRLNSTASSIMAKSRPSSAPGTRLREKGNSLPMVDRPSTQTAMKKKKSAPKPYFDPNNTQNTVRIQFAPDNNDVSFVELDHIGVYKLPAGSRPSSKLKRRKTKKEEEKLEEPSYKDSNEEIKMEFPKWTTLHENYLTQLQGLAANVILKGDGVAAEVEIKKFLSLLAALRTVTGRIVQSYQYLKRARESEVSSIGFEKYHKIKQYTVTIGNSVDWLSENPFLRWAGIDFKLNPFFSTHNIKGIVAVNAMPSSTLFTKDRTLLAMGQHTYSVDLFAALPKELQMTATEFELYKELGNELYDACIHWNAELEEKELQLQRLREEKERRDRTKNANLNFLLFDHPDRSRLEKDFYTSHAYYNYNRTKQWWRTWRRQYVIELGIKDILSAHKYKIKRLVSKIS